LNPVIKNRLFIVSFPFCLLHECLISTSNLNARAAYLSRKNFFAQGVLTIEEGTHNQIAGIFPLGMVAQFIEFSWNL
ncbi:hypothetical protein, partial [Microcystis aeruginosa]|uniref:hypothetical protein n=1 Tax=Microcystis aeruginosa TaxID=1126 RepID=UPI0005C4B937